MVATPQRVPLDLLVAETHGIVTTEALHAAGYDDNVIRRLVRSRVLLRIHRGTYAVGHLAFGEDARHMAAVCSAGPGAAVTGISAGRRWRICERVDRRVEIVVPSERRRFDGAHLTIDRRLPASGIVTVRHVPTVSPTWTIVSLAKRLEPGELARVMREASYRRLLDVPGLARIAEEGRRSGVLVLRRALDLRFAGSDGYASALEATVAGYVDRRVRTRPVPNARIDVGGDRFRVDLVWRELRICAEVDGPIHDDPDVQREDHRRTRLLEAAGWTVVRIHWSDWEADRDASIAMLVHLVNERASQLST